jgi:hypothetical protein
VRADDRHLKVDYFYSHAVVVIGEDLSVHPRHGETQSSTLHIIQPCFSCDFYCYCLRKKIDLLWFERGFALW